MLEQPGEVDPALRQAVSRNDGQALPDALRAYVDTIERQPHKVSDEDLEALKQAGYSEDQLFEITVAAALGAGLRRLEAGLAPLAAAAAGDEETSG